jgi:hypothetical protein
MNPYPKIIKYNDYKDGKVLSNNIVIPTLQLTKSTTESVIRNSVSEISCGPVEIKLNSLTTGKESTGFYNSDDPQHIDIPSADPLRYCFAPLQEDVWIRWKHLNPKLIKESKLQLFCRIDNILTLIWTKTFVWDECPETAKTQFKGSLTLVDEENDKRNNKGLKSVRSEYNRGQFNADFPGECVTSQFSPYKIMLTVVPRNKESLPKPQSVWMYFDILVHDIEFEWCPTTDLNKVLPNTNQARNLAVCQSLADAADNDNLNGAIPTPGQTKKVYLKSHTFYQATSELTDITYYNRYKALWEDGPIIPIFAKAKIRNSNGDGVDAPLGLGKVKFMWDWVDKAADPYTAIGDAGIQAWVDTSRNYKTAVTDESPAGKNCHVDRGGKRGLGAKTCFPQQTGKLPAVALPVHDGTNQMFPFDVTPLNGGGSPFATRKWAAYSHSWASGVLAGKTGVLFQPSRMGGDGYELHVYLAYDTDTDMETVTPGAIRAGLHKNTGTFQIWRHLDIIKHWRMKTTSPVGTLLNLAAVKTKFEKYFIKLTIPAVVDQTLGTWQTTLQNVVNGIIPIPPLPDYTRAAVDHTKATATGHLIPLIDYAVWYNKMLLAHGGTDAALANWANLINNNPNRLHDWEDLNGGNGLQAIVKPWTLNFLPDAVLTTDGTVRIAFPTLPTVASLDIKFERKGGISRKRETTLTPQQRTQLRTKLEEALRNHRMACSGSSNFVSFGRGPNNGGHQPLDVQLSGLQNEQRRRDRLANIHQALEELNWELSKEAGGTNYETSKAKLGWGLHIFDAVIDNVLPAQEGIVALQATDLSNKNLPTGKAFYANAAGNRALAATLAPDPAQQTFEHEIGHALFLCHTYHTQETSDPNYLHQKFSPSSGSCIMHVTPSSGCGATNLFCGFCIVRLWGWSFQMINPANGTVANPLSRTLWYDANYNINPGSPAAVPPHPTDGVKQTEVIDIVGDITTTGNAIITVTAAGMLNTPKTIAVAVAAGDKPDAVANKLRDALLLDADIISFFTVWSDWKKLSLKALDAAANDATMNIALANGTCAGLTAIPTSTHKAAGVATALLHP